MIPKKCFFYSIVVSLSILSCWGCGGTVYQIYKGTRLPSGDIAQITCTDYIDEVTVIDGKKMTQLKHSFFSGGSKFELLPGDHTITVVFATQENRKLSFNVEAGQQYILDRWGNNAVLIDARYETTWLDFQGKPEGGLSKELFDKQLKSLVAPLPDTEDVIVRSLEHNSDVHLVRVDDRRVVNIANGFALRLSPGSHTFEAWMDMTRGLFKASIYGKYSQTVTGDFEPGCTYVVYAVTDPSNQTWKLVIDKDPYHSVKSE